MKILLHDIIQESDAPEQLKSPSLSDVYEYTGPLTIKLDKVRRINAIGIGNINGPTSINFMPSYYWNEAIVPVYRAWSSVTYGNGLFVAVASFSNKSAYSSDGITWTETTMPGNFRSTHVTYGDGRFVVVTDGLDNGAYSNDGITWTEMTMPGALGWSSVTYGNGLFVAVASNSDKSAYSSDGITWTETTMSKYGGNKKINYGNGLFVSVTQSDTVEYSRYGNDWINMPIPLYGDFRDVIFGDGKFVMVGIGIIMWTENFTNTNIYFDEEGFSSFDEILAEEFELETDGTYIGRLAMGLGIEICTSVAKEPSWNSTSEPRVTLSGQVIPGHGGYTYRRISLDSRYRINREAIEEFEAGYKYISMGYPFFIDLTQESYKLPYSFLYAEEDNQRNMSFEGGIKKYLYSRRWNFTERF